MTNSQESPLMVSVSGVRGIIPNSLSYTEIFNYCLAFTKVLNPKQIVIGRDSRPSGLFIQNIILGIFQSLGIDTLLLGIVPTPTVKSVVSETKSDGGIMISASHNPIEWNAFKFIGKKGFFFDAEQINLIKKFVLESETLPKPKFFPKFKSIESDEYSDLHLESVLKRVNVPKIRKRKFHVFLDAVNGGGSYLVPRLLNRLGCKLQSIYINPDGNFPRPPEPTPKALQGSAKLMKKTSAEIGFALDPDADRLVLLSKKKGAILEEYTLPFSLLSVINSSKKNMVVNLSTSSASKKICQEHGKMVYYAKVGEANVVEEMLNKKAFFGGEGNGGVIDPEVSSFGRDSLSGIAHILNYLAETGKEFDTVLNELPKISMAKETVSIQGKNLSLLFNKLIDSFPMAVLNQKDGLRLDLANSWLHVRASNTEPILRLIAESENQNDLQNLIKQVKEIIER
jgi:phosphomannomutase